MSTAPKTSLILGTAGHIDHGKSSLVKALTGVDPDRLAEEKKRGITIELGFAQLVLPSERHVGVVDVPGHEKFVRHMVAGATGVDVALIVIAADDGIMPQTVEHLAVLELLGVRSAVVALSKIDLVDEEWAEFVSDEIAGRLADGPFANAPIIGVSSRTGAGLDELRAALDEACASAEHTKAANVARMPVDRVFTVKGFGTVVTGTLWSGELHEGDELVVMPSEAKTRVRSIQMHGKSAESAPAGNRVAVSLAGLSTDEVRPGDFICAPEAAHLTDRFDAEFTYLDPFSFGRPLKTGARVHVAHGTREVLGRILFMDGLETLNSKGRTFAQIRLEEPLPVAYRDQFIVRSYSPVHVIGGGTVLSPRPRRRTNLKPEEHTMLAALDSGDVDAAIGAHLELAGAPEPASEIAHSCGLDEETVARALARMEDAACVVSLSGREKLFARPALVQKIVSAMERSLLMFHSSNPDATGLAKETLRQTAAPTVAPGVFDALLDEAERRGAIMRTEGEVSHPKASAGARKKEEETAEKIADVLRGCTTPPEIGGIAEELGIDVSIARKAVARLVQDGRVTRIDADRYYDRAVIDNYREVVRTHLSENGPSPASDLKDAMGITRKYAMPLLEHFDSTGLTRREGDLRTLVK